MAVVLDLALPPLAALRPGQRGRVGAVFERSFYVSIAGTEICVGPGGLGGGPLNLRCRSTPRDWRAGGLREGMAVLDALLPERLPKDGLGFLALPRRADRTAQSAIVTAAREPAEALSAFLYRAMAWNGDHPPPRRCPACTH